MKKPILSLPVLLAASLLLAACDSEQAAVSTPPEVKIPDIPEQTMSPPAFSMPDNIPVVDVRTREYTIDVQPTMQLGWNTFRFTNDGNQVHFVAMYRITPGKTVEDQLAEVAPVFDPLMDGLRSGELTKADIGPFLVENLPAWGLQMKYIGGAGLLSPGNTTEATFQVTEPGTYLVECYVKAPDGSWHTMMGMLKQVDVPMGKGVAEGPRGDVSIDVGNSGITAPDTLTAGEHLVRVNFVEDMPGIFFGHDVHLARLADDAPPVEDIAYWMDWSNVGGLRAPAPVEFLGGVENMFAGNHGFLKIDLEPGRYLWISELNSGQVNKVFTVE
ncbi:MAG: hypothetical protein R3270_04180 [Gammaproteobacteria bacterium]|nr:hypothetical protein [Gammaproteobacteria bacterium]